MSYGFNLGRLRSDSTGMSYVDKFDYSGGTVTKTYTSPAFRFTTDVKAILLPTVNIPASTIPTFPTISTSFSVSDQSITVTASGGNVSSSILVFVR